jgi:hypothetical protein
VICGEGTVAHGDVLALAAPGTRCGRHLVIEVRQRPFAISSCVRAIGTAGVVLVLFVALVEPTLVLALQLVVEDDAFDVRTAFQETVLGLFVGAMLSADRARCHPARTRQPFLECALAADAEWHRHGEYGTGAGRALVQRAYRRMREGATVRRQRSGASEA